LATPCANRWASTCIAADPLACSLFNHPACYTNQ
jgi:hypothetical protein